MRNLIVRSNHNPVGILNDFDRVFDSFFKLPTSANVRNPVVDVVEDDKRYLIEAELPGLNEKDVKISVEDNLLIIESAGKSETEDKQDETWLVRERHAWNFRRSFSLPKEADQEKITATFKDGLLTLEVPKLEKAQPRQINIQGA